MPRVIAVCGWIALLLQFYLIVEVRVSNGTSILAGVANYFSYFTILTNLLLAIGLSLLSWAPGSAAGRFFARPPVQAGLAIYIGIVGIIYSLLLRQTWNPQGAQKVADMMLHDLVPLLYVGYWLFRAPKFPLAWRYAFLWLAYPWAYFAYAIGRGAVDGFYPYPFIDVERLGCAQVLSNAALLSLASILLGFAVIRVSRWLSPATAYDSSCCG
jgi:hypothetical protein